MAPNLKISISGVRGIPKESLTPEVVISLSRSFGEYLGSGKVVVGRDPRISSQSIKYQVFSGLLLSGCQIIDLGVVPTPTVQIMVSELKASGGLMITASHNPLPWNGLKFISRAGMFLTSEQFQVFLNWYLGQISSYKKVSWQDVKGAETYDNAIKIHLGKILAKIEVEKIRKRNFRVVVDFCNGSAKEGALALLKTLNCQLIPVNDCLDGTFHRIPEPLSENLDELKKMVLKHQAQIGVAFDPDADRLALVTEKGQAPGEEYTLALATDFILRKKRGPVVTNLSTSRLIDEITRQHRTPVIRTKIGEINVSSEMKKNNAVIGGEGNGGVIWPEVGWGRDGLSALALILNYLAITREPLSALINKFPKYFMVKSKFTCSSLEKITLIIEKLISLNKGKKINLEDGLKIEGPDFWLHIRGSNTEPIIRIISEAKTLKKAKNINQKALKTIKKLAA